MTKENSQQFITGIRIVDVFAPIILDSICRLQWRERTGANILIAELIQRFVRSGGRHVVCAGCLPDVARLQEWQADLKEYELDSFIADGWLDTDLTSSDTQLEDALDYTRELLVAGEDVLFVLLQSDAGEEWGKRATSMFSGLDTEQHFVILTVINFGQDRAEFDEGDCTTRIVLDPARARAGLYPPIDPVKSTASVGVESKLDARRLAIVEQARAVFAAYENQDPDLQDLPNVLDWKGESRDTHQLMPLFRSCAQALYVATPYTGIPGVSDNLEQAITTFERAMQN